VNDLHYAGQELDIFAHAENWKCRMGKTVNDAITHTALRSSQETPPLSMRSPAREGESSANGKAKAEVWILLAPLTGLYATIVSLGLRRPVWFDELLTFDIAKAKTVPQMWEMIGRIDFQPPLIYLLSRFSMRIVGATPLGLRLPSMVAFYAASLTFFFYVRRKLGNGYAVCALLLLWVGQTGPFATEARPYALFLMFFAVLLLSWDVAATSEKRTLALWGVGLSNVGMLSVHVFAPLSLFPFLAAEAARFSRTRKPDLRLWAALLLPIAVTALNLPLVFGYGAVYFPPAFQASWGKLPHFYYATMSEIGVALFLALCAALLVPRNNSAYRAVYRPRREEIILYSCLFVIPLLLDPLLMSRHGAFWDRYAITTEAAIYIGMVILLGLRLKGNRYAGYAAAAVLLVLCVKVNVWRASLVPKHQDASILDSVRPDLPLVVAGPVPFFEMNHREEPKLLSRLFFLKDRAAAIRYTHTNLFEDRGFPNHRYPAVPISAQVEDYSEFVRKHPKFLVLGNLDAPEEWLLPKLKDDGAQLTWLGAYPIPYVDSNLYLIDVRGAK
jgi:hypothetical protein